MSTIRLRLAAVALPAALVLAGCGDKPATPDAPPPSTAAAPAQSAELAGVKVEGKAGAKPTITLPSTPFTVSAPGYRIVAPGTGKALGAEDSVSAHFLLLNGKDGKEIQSQFGSQVVGLSLSDQTLQPAIKTALSGQKVGSKVLVAVPAKEAVGEQGNPQIGVGPQDTLLYYFEVTGAQTPLKQATGTPVPPKPGLPTVKMPSNPTQPATITIPKSAPPKKTVVQPLIRGKGPKVAAGQTVRVSYTGVTWRDPAKPFDWSGKSPNGYFEFPAGQGRVIKAWDSAIVGQPVGSRLLVIAPPADAYGPQGQPDAGIKGNDTLVFVADILAAN